jgi:hypothetical protein
MVLWWAAAPVGIVAGTEQCGGPMGMSSGALVVVGEIWPDGAQCGGGPGPVPRFRKYVLEFFKYQTDSNL